MGRRAKTVTGRPANKNVQRVRWAAVMIARVDRKLTWEGAYREASTTLKTTAAAGSDGAMRVSYGRENKILRAGTDRAKLARELFEKRDAILTPAPFETAAVAILKLLESAAGPMTVDDFVSGSCMKYRAVSSAASRLYTAGKIFRSRPGLYYLPTVAAPPPPPPSCLQAMQASGREMTSGDLTTETHKTKDAVVAEMRRLIRDGKAVRVQSAAPGRFAAFALTPAAVVLPAQVKRRGPGALRKVAIGRLSPTADIAIIRELLQANGGLRSVQQLQKKLAEHSESAIAAGLYRLVEGHNIFKHFRGLYGLSAPG